MNDKKEIPDLTGLIRDTIGGEVIEQHVTSLLPPGENYGSIMYKVDFTVRKDGTEKVHHAVAKCTPLNAVTQRLFNTQETFKGEIAWYTTVIPALKQFVKKQGIELKIDFFQQYYGSRISLDPASDLVDADGVILTTNLKYAGYKNVDRHHGFDGDTTKVILEDLATFHAVCLAMRRKDPEMFRAKITPYMNLFKADNDETKNYLRGILVVFDHIPSCKHLLERINQSMETSVSYDLSYREPWTTIVHHDFWCNNIMITEDQPPKATILDLQTTVIGSPATDVIFFLLTSVKSEDIENKLDDFLQYYYDHFTSQLKSLGVDIVEFSYDSFVEEVNIVARIGQYIHALGHSSMIMYEKGYTSLDSSDANYTLDTIEMNFNVNEKHIRKFEWITREAEKRNWI